MDDVKCALPPLQVQQYISKIASRAWHQMTSEQKDEFGSHDDYTNSELASFGSNVSTHRKKIAKVDGRRRIDITKKCTPGHRLFLARQREIKAKYNLPPKPIYPALIWAYGNGRHFLKERFQSASSTEIMRIANSEFHKLSVSERQTYVEEYQKRYISYYAADENRKSMKSEINTLKVEFALKMKRDKKMMSPKAKALRKAQRMTRKRELSDIAKFIRQKEAALKRGHSAYEKCCAKWGWNFPIGTLASLFFALHWI
jgi:hypothetical protein